MHASCWLKDERGSPWSPVYRLWRNVSCMCMLLASTESQPKNLNGFKMQAGWYSKIRVPSELACSQCDTVAALPPFRLWSEKMLHWEIRPLARCSAALWRGWKSAAHDHRQYQSTGKNINFSIRDSLRKGLLARDEQETADSTWECVLTAQHTARID